MVLLDFAPELTILLKRDRDNPLIEKSDRRASLKDMIEAAGVPHTEVAFARSSGGKTVALDHLPGPGECFFLIPWRQPVDPEAWGFAGTIPKFIADANVARLGRYLRLAGFDTLIAELEHDGEIVARARRQGRIILSRDRGLLMRKTVSHGRLIREELPARQLGEVIAFFGLAGMLRPESRCPLCNGKTIKVTKEKVIDRLEPLTRKYYEEFHQCRECGQLYWPGSHRERFAALLARALKYPKE